jgi:hypothetical protein
MTFESFKIIRTKNLDIIVGSSSVQKLNPKLVVLRAQQKWPLHESRSSEKCTISNFEILADLSFLARLNITIFRLIFCTLVDLMIIYIKILCPDIFETLKYFLKKIQKRAPCNLGAICPLCTQTLLCNELCGLEENRAAW